MTDRVLNGTVIKLCTVALNKEYIFSNGGGHYELSRQVSCRAVGVYKAEIKEMGSGNKLNMFNLLRLCRKDEISFDIVQLIVVETDNIVAKNGNNIEATFNFAERTILR